MKRHPKYHILVKNIRPKKSWIILLSIFLASSARSQNLSAMIQQIVKLQVFIVKLEKGYQIVQKGLTLIGDIKQGDFNLHNDFFNSLHQVNPVIKSSAEIADIVGMQSSIISDYKIWLNKFQQAGNFNSTDLSYIRAIYSNLLDLLSKDLDELTNIVSNGKLEMNDGERINQIEKLYMEVLDKYKFFYDFTEQVNLKSVQQTAALTESQTLSKLFNQ